MSEKKKSMKSPFGVRFAIWSGSFFLSLLLIWLIGFVLKDVGDFGGVDRAEVSNKYVGEDLAARDKALREQLAQVSWKIKQSQEREKFLTDNIGSSRQTIEQMRDLQRLSLEKTGDVPQEQQDALSEAETAFLRDQASLRTIRDELIAQRERKLETEREHSGVKARMSEKRREADLEYFALVQKQRTMTGLLKLGILLPAVFAAAWLFARKRSGPFAPLVYAVCIAVACHLIWVIHSHFPMRFFKYVYVLAAILIVLRILWTLIRGAIRPSASLLLKRYREAYRKAQCPVCGHPILRGTAQLIEMATQGRIHRRVSLNINTGMEDEERPYTCPSCGETLFEECKSCSRVRHALLPSCQHCGTMKDNTLNPDLP